MRELIVADIQRFSTMVEAAGVREIIADGLKRGAAEAASKRELLLDLKRQLDQFRMRNYELQTKHCPDNLYDEMDCFQREYEQFREIPLVHDFLAAELALCRLVQEVSDGVMRAVAEDFE